MAEVTLTVPVSPERVFEVLSDGWSYAGWVVGASHIRDVDAGWPARGTRIHHSVGPWPLDVDDVTVVRRVEDARLLELEGRAWPIGAALIRFELEPVDATSTRVRLVETAARGPATLLPRPVQDALLIPRNKETLARLADVAVRA